MLLAIEIILGVVILGAVFVIYCIGLAGAEQNGKWL